MWRPCTDSTNLNTRRRETHNALYRSVPTFEAPKVAIGSLPSARLGVFHTEGVQADGLPKDSIECSILKHIGHSICKHVRVGGSTSSPMNAQAVSALENLVFLPRERADATDSFTTLAQFVGSRQQEASQPSGFTPRRAPTAIVSYNVADPGPAKNLNGSIHFPHVG